MSHPRLSNPPAATTTTDHSRNNDGTSIRKSPQSDGQFQRPRQHGRRWELDPTVVQCDSGGGYRGSLERRERTPQQPPSSSAVLAEDGGQEAERMSMVRRKKDFRHMEKVNGKMVNILQGLELHTGVFSAEDQKQIVDCVYDLQEKGRQGLLRERTYSEPRKWMRGKGRITLQFGCCYNYAVDKHGNPPGIIRDEYVDPIPPLLKAMIKRMVAWQVLPPTCIPNSCIVNIYDKDDCIPPHIDHHDFLRPFCTVSFLSECKILFGTGLKVLAPGEFLGSSAISLPLGSVLVLNGNGADVAKHCVPAVPSKRISITFRKMDESKQPYKFVPDPDMQNLQRVITHVRPPPAQDEGNRAWAVQQEEDNNNNLNHVPDPDMQHRFPPLLPPSSSAPPAQDEGSRAPAAQQEDSNHVPDPGMQHRLPPPPSMFDSEEKYQLAPWPANHPFALSSASASASAWGEDEEGRQSSKKPSVLPQSSGSSFRLRHDDFPPLGSSGRAGKRPSRPPRQI